MRSYEKIVQSPDLKTIVPFKFVKDAGGGFPGSLMRLQRLGGLAACQGYNLIAQVDWWIGFSGGDFPINLVWGDSTTLNTPQGNPSHIVTGAGGLTLANSCFQVLPWETHPEN